MPKRTLRNSGKAPSQKTDHNKQHICHDPDHSRPARRDRHQKRQGFANTRSKKNSRRHPNRRDLMRHLLRGAAYGTGAGLIGLLFWWLRLQIL